MKVRMIWKWETEDGWWGTCDTWYRTLLQKYGTDYIKRRRVMWVGIPPACSNCNLGVSHV